MLISLPYVRAPSTAPFIWTGASVNQSQISWPVPISSGIHTTLATTTTFSTPAWSQAVQRSGHFFSTYDETRTDSYIYLTVAGEALPKYVEKLI